MKIQQLVGVITVLSILMLFAAACTTPSAEESPTYIVYIEDPVNESSDLTPPEIMISADIDTHSGIATLTLFAEDDSGIKHGLFHIGGEVIFCETYPCIKQVNVEGKTLTYYSLVIDNSENGNAIRYPTVGTLSVGLIDVESFNATSNNDIQKFGGAKSNSGKNGRKNSEKTSYSENQIQELINIIDNYQFQSKNNWNFYTNGEGNFNIDINNITEDAAGEISIDVKGNNTQLYQENLKIEGNTTYILSFDALSTNFKSMDVSILKHTAPYTSYGLDMYQVNLSNNWSTQSIIFTTPIIDSPVYDARLMFWITPYVTSGDVYWIDNVILTKYCSECNKPQDDNKTAYINMTKPNNITTNITKPNNNASSLPVYDGKLPTPSKGKKWSLTFYDEFNGKSIDTSKWRGGYSNLKWCPPNSDAGGKCPNKYTGLAVSDGVLKLQPRVTEDYSTAYENRAIMHTGGNDANDAKFFQKYGYFEVKAKFPTNKDGEGDGLWISFWALPLGKTNNAHNLGDGIQQEEIDIMESVLGNNINYTYLNLHDYILHQYSVKYPKVSVGDLSDKFHTYGLYWKDDGSKYGSIQAYFDGVPQGKPIVLNERSNYWSNGIYLILQIIPCPLNNRPFQGGSSCTPVTSNNNPFIVDYVRAYKEVPS